MEKIMHCEKHGETIFVLRKDGRWRCKKCCSESVSERRRKIKEKIVQYKGGKCEICGYDKCIDALEFHHLDPSSKDFGIGQYGKSLEQMKKEADKCILVCANCHREIHFKERGIMTPIKRGPLINETNANKIKELQENGLTQKEIAKEIGVSLSTLKRFLKNKKDG